MTNNKVKTLPEEIGSLEVLRTLDCEKNELEVLPIGIGSLPHLVIINLKGNMITHLPDQFCNLSRLKELDLSCNKLTTFPPQIRYLERLNGLYLENNLIEHVSAEDIETLVNLEYFWVQNNFLKTVPVEMWHLNKLKSVKLFGNPDLKFSPPSNFVRKPCGSFVKFEVESVYL